jgi:cellulase (glycosyl hydrolase family 5)
MKRLALATLVSLSEALFCAALPGATPPASSPTVPAAHLTGSPAPSRGERTGRMERVRVSRDGQGFVLARSGRPFHPWGANYGNAGRLIEDFWESDWETVAQDFREMKDLGYNVTRVHLQLGKFMTAPDKPNARALDRLERLLRLAEKTGLYLDLTGLGCYRKADVPSWYDALTEEERWAVQARFWASVARRCAGSPAVFCYDLMNEPLAPGGRRKPGEWYSGHTLGGYDFLQYIALDQGDRPRHEIARRWIRRITEAIRKHDRKTLITVGLLPSTPQWGHFSGFVPEQVAPELDFVSVHIYPASGKVAEAVGTLKQFAVGKPVVIEETFPLSCSSAELEEFLLETRKLACGWMGHYDGVTPGQYEEKRRAKTLTIAEALWLAWLELSRKLKPQMVSR